jgi:hypothetical protein
MMNRRNNSLHSQAVGATTVGRLLIVLLVCLVLLGAWRFFVVWSKPKDESTADTVRVMQGIEVSYILTPKRAAGLDPPFSRDFDVTSSGNIVIGASGSLLELEPDGSRLTADKVNGNAPAPESFALDGGEALLTIAGDYFGQLDNGEYSRAVPLPVKGMRLAPSANAGTVYLFGGDGVVSRRLYAMHRDGQFSVLVDLPEPITAIADNQRSVYVATASDIYRVTAGVLQLVIRLPENTQPLVSLAASADDNILYFASPRRVYALHGFAAISIVNDAGGTLRILNQKLYLWDQSRSLLVSLTGMETALRK